MNEREQLLTSILKCERVDLYSQPPNLSAEQEAQLRDMENRLRQHEPVQYIIGECEFMGLKFKVDARVLIPRPETELLVENLLKLIEQHHGGSTLQILDIGTGSGNIAVSLAHFVAQTKVWAIDVSEEALQLARNNALLNHVAHKVDFIHVDIREFYKNYTEAEKRFDIIVSNPPYIPAGALSGLPLNVQQEPRLALDGGGDGLNFYRVIIRESRRFLKTDGFLICEIGDGQKESLSEFLQSHGFSSFYFLNDYTGTPRHFVAQN